MSRVLRKLLSMRSSTEIVALRQPSVEEVSSGEGGAHFFE